jgi:hypothetical protein
MPSVKATFPELAAEQDRDRVADGCPQRSAFDHRVDDRLYPIVGDNEIGGLLRGVGAAHAERDAHVGELDRRGVVRAAPGYGHDPALRAAPRHCEPCRPG